MNVLLCPMSDAGYLYPAVAVGRELRDRGHDAVVLGRASVASVPAHAGLPFLAAEELGEANGFSVRSWSRQGLAQYRAVLRAVPVTRADVIVTSALSHGALLAAEVLDLPVVVLGLAAYLWEYPAGAENEPKSPAARAWRTRGEAGRYRSLREQAGLQPRRDRRPETPLLGTTFLLRGHPSLEYPGALLPGRVRHVGPCAWEPPAAPAELAEIDAHLGRIGKPVVYVHLGRWFQGPSLWPLLNAAFADGPFQAVVELGRSEAEEPAPGTDILVVHKPWMAPLIDRAELVLSGGTSAPVLNALLRGRPLALAPIGSEQPLLAEACVRAGVALCLPQPAGAQSLAALRAACDDGLRGRAAELGRALAAADSTRRAADAVAGVAHALPVSPGQ
jgi:UDP:flavonoid glycosyltransferase YjiC (YdhE family)